MSLFKTIALVALCTAVIANKQCSKNANLWKSIQYQLKLVESTEGRGNCGSTNSNNHKKVAFLVRCSKTIENLDGDVVYDTVITNTGSGYDASNGHFVAPYEGLYFFSWTTTTLASKHFFTSIMHNGKQIAGNHAGARGVTTEQMTATQSIVLQLAPKDKVCIRTQGTQKYMFGTIWSTFTGFKI